MSLAPLKGLPGIQWGLVMGAGRTRLFGVLVSSFSFVAACFGEPVARPLVVESGATVNSIRVEPLPRPGGAPKGVEIAPSTSPLPRPESVPLAGPNDPPRTIVSVCSSVDPALFAICRKWRARMADPATCPGAAKGLRVLALDDPTPEELGAIVKRLPHHTPVFLDGHGAMLPKDIRKPEGPGNPEVHYMPVPVGKGKYGKVTIRLVPTDPSTRTSCDIIETDAFKKAVEAAGTEAGVWIGTCMAGGGCKPGDRCSGGACRADEYSVNVGDAAETTIEELSRLLCDPKSFEKKAILGPEDLKRDFCSRWGGDLVEPLKMFALRKVADWKSPLPADVHGEEIKVTPAADPGEIDDFVRAKQKEHPGKVVRKKSWGKTFRLRYRDGDGKPQTAVVEGLVYESEGAATASLDRTSPGWRKDCASLVLADAGSKATDCALEETGELFGVEVRKPSGACIAEPTFSYHPEVNTFSLHSPYAAPGAAASGPGLPAIDASHR